MTVILDFYGGTGLGAGRSFEDVLTFTDDQMESEHGFIQWLFPLPEPSKAHPQAPVMASEELMAFREDPELRRRVHRALERYWRFLADTKHWRRVRDHNHLRITRVIRFLTLIGMKETAKDFHQWVLLTLPAVLPWMEHTQGYWSEALKEHPAWLT